MSVSIKVEILDSPTADVAHRFRNFGEDVYRALREVCEVRIEEIDAATTNFVVHDIHRRDLGGATQVIKRALKKHGFEHSVTLTKL